MKKSKKIIIICLLISLVAGMVSGAVFGIIAGTNKYTPLSNLSRIVLSYNYAKLTLGAKKELKREISSEKPLNLLNYYGDEDIELLWQSIPKNQRDYTVLLIIPGHTLNAGNNNSVLFLEESADKCEQLKIPYAIQHINGEIHGEERLPIAYLEERFAKKHRYFYGLNGAELYNGVVWRGKVEADQSLYLINSIKLCAKYGGFFFWTDTNRNYKSGMLLEWLESNESFYSTFKNYSEYICLLNKESYGDPSTYSVMLGLWLAGLVGNWGVASDWWHWQVDGDKKSLFGLNDKLVNDEWDMIFSFPENMYVQSMMLVMSMGGTCFKAEAPNFSTSVKGNPVGGFEYGISPMLDNIINGNVKIPTKEEVFNSIKVAVLGRDNYIEDNYDLNASNLYPKRGESGILPLLPTNLRLSERKVFLDNGIKLIDYKLTENDLNEIFGNYNADTYLSNCGNSWYFIHNSENIQEKKYGEFKPKLNSAESVYIKSDEHTSAIINENQEKLSFFVSNYRTDKTQMLKDYKGQIKNGEKWADFVERYLTLDSEGNPKGVSDTEKREVIVSIKGELNGGKPQVIFKSNNEGGGKGERPFEYTEVWDNQTKTLTLTIKQNGWVEFEVYTDKSDKQNVVEKKPSIAETKLTHSIDTTKAEDLIKNKITDAHNYTYYSYLNYDRAYEKVANIISEKTYTQIDFNNAVEELAIAQEKLYNFALMIPTANRAILAILDIDVSVQDRYNIGKKLDLFICATLANQKYTVGRARKLSYSAAVRNCSEAKALDNRKDIGKYHDELKAYLDKLGV